MRRNTIGIAAPLLALFLALFAPASALAGAGLPRLARMDIGPYQALIMNDSPQLRTGTNTLTIAVPDLPLGTDISLRFSGPSGQVIAVPLKPLRVLSGPADDHGGDGHSNGAESHGTDSHESDSHDSESAAGGHGHGDQDEFSHAAYQVRGKVVLDQTGTWEASLTIEGLTERFSFDVIQGGPNRLFLGVSGSVMGGALIYGIVERRRQPNGGVR